MIKKQTLAAAYQATTYQIKTPKINIKIGQLHPDLDELLIDNNVYTWAFISAWNPHSKLATDANNQIQHEKLKASLSHQNYRFLEGLGIPAQADWVAEVSLLVLDISKNSAIDLAQKFQQSAIVYGALSQEAELVWL